MTSLMLSDNLLKHVRWENSRQGFLSLMLSATVVLKEVRDL